MEHTYYTCDRCKSTFQHKDPMNSLYVAFPKKVDKKEKSPFEKMFGENSNLVMIPIPGFPMPSIPEEDRWPKNMKEMCPECEIEFVRWWNKEFVASKLGVEPVEDKV